MLTYARIALGFFVAAGLAGCGFQLAAQPTLPASLQRVSLVAEDTRSGLYLALSDALLEQGVILDATAPTELRLSDVSTGQRVLSVSARNVPREYEVFYTAAFVVRRGTRELMRSGLLTYTRDYNWSEFEVLGKVQEEEQLRELIVADLVDAIVRQLSTLP